MNKCRLELIAEWLEKGTPVVKGVTAFNMSAWRFRNSCGTTCCIAGTAVEWFGGDITNVELEAQQLLGISRADAIDLFFARNALVDRQDITPAYAARTIRKYIETGKVDWRGTYEPVPTGNTGPVA